MTKLLLCLLGPLCGLTLSSVAAPFISADPTSESVTSYGCSFNGGAQQLSAPVVLMNGQKQLHADAGGLSQGRHTVICVAKNAESTSPPSASFSFRKRRNQ